MLPPNAAYVHACTGPRCVAPALVPAVCAEWLRRRTLARAQPPPPPAAAPCPQYEVTVQAFSSRFNGGGSASTRATPRAPAPDPIVPPVTLCSAFWPPTGEVFPWAGACSALAAQRSSDQVCWSGHQVGLAACDPGPDPTLNPPHTTPLPAAPTRLRSSPKGRGRLEVCWSPPENRGCVDEYRVTAVEKPARSFGAAPSFIRVNTGGLGAQSSVQ